MAGKAKKKKGLEIETFFPKRRTAKERISIVLAPGLVRGEYGWNATLSYQHFVVVRGRVRLVDLFWTAIVWLTHQLSGSSISFVVTELANSFPANWLECMSNKVAIDATQRLATRKKCLHKKSNPAKPIVRASFERASRRLVISSPML